MKMHFYSNRFCKPIYCLWKLDLYFNFLQKRKQYCGLLQQLHHLKAVDGLVTFITKTESKVHFQLSGDMQNQLYYQQCNKMVKEIFSKSF